MTTRLMFILGLLVSMPAHAFQANTLFQRGTVFFADPTTVEEPVYVYDSDALDGTDQSNGSYHLEEKGDGAYVLITPDGKFKGQARACYKSPFAPAYIVWEANDEYFTEQANTRAKETCVATTHIQKVN